MTLQIYTQSAQATFDLGLKFASILTPSTVVILTGELGAGKTTFTKGIAAGLGIQKEITSPTFVIAKNYQTESGIQLIHIDAYRLASPSDIHDLDLEAQIDNAIVIAEWGKGFVENFGKVIHVNLTFDSQDTRLITISSDEIDIESFDV